MSHSLLLFDDQTACTWDPFVLTRPAGELLFGAFLLRERAERYWGVPCRGHLSPEALAGFSEPGSPPVVSPEEVPRDGHNILVSSRAAPTGSPPCLPDEAATLVLEGQTVGWILSPGTPVPSRKALLDPAALPGSPQVELEGRLLDAPWALMAQNAEQLSDDIPRFFPGYAADELPGSQILGDRTVSLGSGVVVEPFCVFDTSNGPIRLSDDVAIRSHPAA